MEVTFFDIVLRLGVAVLVGAAVGLNRDLANKPIGVRTLGLVALGSAVVALAALNYAGLSKDPAALSRLMQGVIQGVMVGIGFLGAGVILRNVSNGEIYGLTTAASVWVTAAIAIACALGQWLVVAIAVGIALLLLILVGWVERLLGIDDKRGDR